MREILFRGKRRDNGKWVKGFYVCDPQEDFEHKIYVTNIHPCGYCLIPYSVIPETIGQYTGLTENGKKIFEGDIVKSFEYDDIYLVKYFDNNNYPAFDCVPDVPDVPFCECNGLSFLVNTEGCEVIGNIYDNPELLKGDKDNG